MLATSRLTPGCIDLTAWRRRPRLWLTVTAMLAIASLIAVLIGPATGQSFEVLLITFAPGGVNEMALVALSLDANPAFVTLHHVFRIGITVLALGMMKRLLTRRRAGTDTPEEL